MAMAGAAFLGVPAELVGDPSATKVASLAGDTPVLLVAGPDEDGVPTISAVTDTWVETLWPLETTGPAPDARPADLVPTGTNQALALLPGEALLLLSPLAEDEDQRTQRLKPRPARLPDRLFATGDSITGLWLRARGKTLLATLDARGMRDKSSERFGPELKPGQVVTIVLRDGAGRDVVIAEDHRTGFQAWRRNDLGDWVHLTADGAARHGLNASVACALPWGERVILATGSSTAVRQALPGMPISGELIVLEPDGQLHLLAGELRVSPTGLMVPGLSAGALVTLNALRFSHLAIDDAGRLIVTAVRRKGDAGLFAIAPDMTVTPLADPCETILGLVPDPAAPGRIGAVTAQYP